MCDKLIPLESRLFEQEPYQKAHSSDVMLDNAEKAHNLSTPTHCSACRKLRKLFPPDPIPTTFNRSFVDCVCPFCGTIHPDLVDLVYRTSECAWFTGGYPVVLCDCCRDDRPSVQLAKLVSVKSSGVRRRVVSLAPDKACSDDITPSNSISDYWTVDKVDC